MSACSGGDRSLELVCPRAQDPEAAIAFRVVGIRIEFRLWK